MEFTGDRQVKIVNSTSYVLEDVPHITDYMSDLPTYPNPLEFNPAYSVAKQYFVNADDTVAQKIVDRKDNSKGTPLPPAGPCQKVFFESDEVHACIITCGGLCPGLNTVIREIVWGLYHMYGVNKVIGINGGYEGLYAQKSVALTPNVVNDIHKRGGTILETSRGCPDTSKIVDTIQVRGFNQVYIIGGDRSQKEAAFIFEEIRRRGLKVSVAGIPKAIDNDFPVIDRSFGFDTVVEEAQRAINAAHVEAESIENGIGVVKLMGRYCGFVAMYATLASQDVDCCLIPESPFYLEGRGGLFEYIEKRLEEHGHMVIVIAEGAAGQDRLSESLQSMDQQDASGKRLLKDIGQWISQRIKDHFGRQQKLPINLIYIDPTYMIRAVPSNAADSVYCTLLADSVYCTLLADSAVNGAMAGYTGFIVGPVNGRHSYIPFNHITENQNKDVDITDWMWARLLSSTNQPRFLIPKDVAELQKEEEPPTAKCVLQLRNKEGCNLQDPKFKYIFCDMDGTLLNSKTQISSTTAEALKEVSSRGLKIVIATGKTRSAVINIFKVVNLAGKDGIVSEFSPGVFCQGLLVYGRQGREIFRRNLDSNVCREGEIMPSVDHLLAAGDIQKVIFMDTAKGVATTLRPYWSAATRDRAAVVQAQPDMLEIVPTGTSKGGGVKMLLDHLGISPEEIMAIGDGENDVEMLKLASLGIALSNGSEKAKAAANIIGASNDEDGAAEAIYRYAF